MNMRPYTARDAQATLEVFHAAVSITAAEHYEPEQITAWRSGAGDLGHWRSRIEAAATCHVMEDAAGVFAFATLNPDGEVDLLMCHPRRARQGAAAKLLQQLESDARQSGLSRMFTQASMASRGVFERSGFAMTERRTVGGMACFGMEKKLPAA